MHLLALATELLMPHATDTAAYAARLITRGPFRHIFWGGAVVLGVLLPVALLAVGWGHAGLVGTAGAAGAGRAAGL